MRSIDAGVERLARNVAASQKGGATEIALPPHGWGTSLMLGARQRLRPDGAYGPMIIGICGCHVDSLGAGGLRAKGGFRRAMKLPPHKLGVPAGSTAIVVSAVADPRRTPDWRDDMESADAAGDAADASAFMRTSESASNWRMCSDSRLKRSAASRFALWLLPRSYFPISPAARRAALGTRGHSRLQPNAGRGPNRQPRLR